MPGGFNSVQFGGPLNFMQIYSTTTDTWSTGMPLPATRAGAAVVAYNNQVYIISGYTNPFPTGTNTVYIYNPATDMYTTGASMPAVNGNVPGVLLGNEIYVVGGGVNPGAHYAYNPATNTWRTIASMPITTCQSGNGFVFDGELWIVGCLGMTIANQVWIYNPGTDTWRKGPPYTVDHQSPGTALFNGRGFVVGGGAAAGGSTAVESLGCSETTTMAANVITVFSASNQNVALSATVTSAGGPVNEGTVTFTVKQGATTIGSPVISSTVANGQASVNYILPGNTPPGVYTIQADYSGGANFQSSSDNTYTLTVDPVSGRITDPAVCTGPGNILQFQVQVTNSGTTAQTVDVSAPLPSTLLGLPGSCTFSGTVGGSGTCTVAAGQVSFAGGQLAAGQTLTLNYQAQVANGTPPGTPLCVTSSFSFNGVTDGSTTFCTSVSCPGVGPGTTPPATAAVSDQKAGSVLFYNLYTSNPADLTRQNTRINLTNTDPSRSVAVHLFFVDGATCTPADFYVCLTPSQTVSFLASDVDPGTTGYIVAIASDPITGCPINFNFLIGDEFVKLSSGHQANLAAESFAALTGVPPVCAAGSLSATLNFDGVSYNQVPRVVAVDNFPSTADGNNTLLILNRIGGDLSTGASRIGALFGVLFDEAEQPLSFTLTSDTCQFRVPLTNSSLRILQRLETVIGPGRTGWLRLWGVNDIGLLGSVINFNGTAGTNNFSQGHNLHKLTLTSASLTIPIIPPACQ